MIIQLVKFSCNASLGIINSTQNLNGTVFWPRCGKEERNSETQIICYKIVTALNNDSISCSNLNKILFSTLICLKIKFSCTVILEIISKKFRIL